MRPCIWLLAVLSLALATCSDDTQPTHDTRAPGDGLKAADQGKVVPGAEAGPGWLDLAVTKPDAQAWGCTPGPTMCNGYKTQYCNNGVCTPCPADSTDCDRQGDCECKGVCDGTKCKAP